MAMTKPASTIVFIAAPVRYSSSPADSKDKGIATVAITAARHSYRNTIITSTTSTQPINRACDRFLIESSM